MSTRRRVGFTTAALLLGVGLAAPSAHATQPSQANLQAIKYVSGSSVTKGSCKGWMNRNTRNGYVQGVGQSWGDTCTMWLQRYKVGYGWYQLSDYYTLHNDKRSTGFHSNGTNLAARVCIELNWGNKKCGKPIW